MLPQVVDYPNRSREMITARHFSSFLESTRRARSETSETWISSVSRGVANCNRLPAAEPKISPYYFPNSVGCAVMGKGRLGMQRSFVELAPGLL